jgi:type I restriction enzyme S subunit
MKRPKLSTAQDLITEAAVKASATSLIDADSVLMVTRSGILSHSLPVALNLVPVALNQDIKAITPSPATDGLFLWFAFKCFERDILNECRKGGTTVHSIEFPSLLDFVIPLPPLAEQKRIVSKIEELFSELDAGEESLRRARRQLGVYRQSLLKQAFEGKLTAPWRKQNPQLLESSWHEVEVSEVLTSKPTNGRSVKDRIGGFKVLRLTALRGGKIDLREYKEGDWEAAEAANHVVRKGDFLLSRGNGSINLVGRGGVVMENADIAFPDTMIRLPLDLRLVDPSFFVYLWNSHQVRRQIEESARTTAGIYKINQSLLTRYRLPLCSLPEQREIVRLLDEQFTVIEQNEREIDAALKRSAALRQSILKKAFTGQLVPQDPTDEPASALLERLRKEADVRKCRKSTVK